jgi:type VI secretion system secreted protein VgrG
MSSGLAPFELSVDGFASGHFRVHSLSGDEKMSEAWCFDVVATAPAGDEVEQVALGRRGSLTFNLADKQRAFYGVIAAVRLAEVHAVDRRIKYRLRLVPRLWLLRRRKRTRIFQGMRVPDIVSSVLLETGIATRWQLTRPYAVREYTTQYEETDYQFVRRILAEAGIWFYFFGGAPVTGAALAVDAALDATASADGAVASFAGGSAAFRLVGAAAQMGETLVPGDTVIGADDAVYYPAVGGDDPAALAASTAAALAPVVGDLVGAGGGLAGAAVGATAALASTVFAEVSDEAASVPALHFMGNEAANVARHDKVTRFSLRNTVRSSAAAFRSYDPDRPMVRLQSAAVSTQPFPPSPAEVAAQAAAAAENAASAGATLPGPAAGALGAASGAVVAAAVAGQIAGTLGAKAPHEVYEHHDPFLFPKWAFALDEAPRILRQKRRRASIAEGASGCSDLSPGHRFDLVEHPAPQLDAPYVVTRVEHRGELHGGGEGGWNIYENTFECAPATVPYAPRRPERTSVQVMLTATVVGPAGEDIHVDARGQIKVQFHWDRDGRFDERSSCWIRVMQPWAGAAWGHQFIPRVGMEA